MKKIESEFKADRIITYQQVELFIIACIFALGFYFITQELFPILINIIIHLVFICIIFMKLYFVFKAFLIRNKKFPLAEGRLNTYCILVPLYKEWNIAESLIKNLMALDYPTELLNIRILLEEKDTRTVEEITAALKKHKAPHITKFIVPSGFPQTKPRVCTIALDSVTADVVTIYDAEDKPDPDQLRKVIQAFRELPEDYAGVQCRLNFYNESESWITRFMFTEYLMWYKYGIPGIAESKVVMPLGGTSNHFKTAILKELGGWDAFNLTEDADLGVRVFRAGYKIGYVDSVTQEEAPLELDAWIKQRARWIQGHIQTWLVHMRSPSSTLKDLGWKNFFVFNFLIGAGPVVALLSPVLYTTTIIWFLFKPTYVQFLFPDYLATVGTAIFIIGTCSLTLMNVFLAIKEGKKLTALLMLLTPIYWLFHSIAASRSIYRLFTSPYAWEKTEHGKTKQKT